MYHIVWGENNHAHVSEPKELLAVVRPLLTDAEYNVIKALADQSNLFGLRFKSNVLVRTDSVTL